MEGGRWVSAQWHEADGLLTYDDHLFVLEVKAGDFTYTSPATDLPAHIESLKNLVFSRAGQSVHRLSESGPEVSIFDADHNEIGRIRRSDFRHVTVCAVTLDAFTELAARANHLRNVGINVGERSVGVVNRRSTRLRGPVRQPASIPPFRRTADLRRSL